MRIGLFGTGPWARTVHAPALRAHPGVELTGVWGRREEAAADLAGQFGVRPYRDADALIADCDAVAIALPPDIQADLATRAAAAGRHLLLDKPLATDLAAARRVVETAQRTGAASVVFFTVRFNPEPAAWIAAQAEAGGWFTARAEWLNAVFSTDSPFAASPWRREKGGLWDVGPHALSVLLPILGPATEVTAARGPADTVHLVLRHKDGASSTVALTLTAPPKAAGYTVELRGETGVETLPPGSRTPVEALGAAADALLEAVRTGEPHPCDAAFGMRVVAVLSAAERSLAAAAPVRVED